MLPSPSSLRSALTRLLALAAIALVAGPPAFAQSDDAPVDVEARARELYDNGRILYEEGRYEEAILAWEEAYRLSQRPRLQFNLANAHERLGNLKKALDALYAYQAFAKAEERDAIERRIRTIEDRMEAEKANPVPVPTPVPVPVPVPVPGPDGPRERGGGPPVAGIALIGVGAVAAGAGAVFGISSASARGKLEEACVDQGGDRFCPVEVRQDLEKHRRNALIADVGFAVGAVSAGIGIVTLAVGGKSTNVEIGLGNIRLNGRF